jgi:hypothetical protein
MTSNSPFRSRKFILAMSTSVQATGLLIAGLLDGREWMTITGAALALYSTANVLQKATSSAVTTP